MGQNVHQIKLQVDLHHFIRPLTKDEKEGLEQDLKEHGCRDPLVVWKTSDGLLLVDGHNRFEICERLDIPYQIVEMQFDNIHAAQAWIIPERGYRLVVPLLEDVGNAQAHERRAGIPAIQ